MTCLELDDNIALYAAGALEGPEREVLQRHLASGCPTCAGKLAESEAAFSLIGLSALEPGLELPEELKARLDARIDGLDAGVIGVFPEEGLAAGERAGLRLADDAAPAAEPSPMRIPVPVDPVRQQTRIAMWPLAVAACLAAAVTGGVMYMRLADAFRQNQQLIASTAEFKTTIETLTQETSQNKSQLQDAATKLANAEKQLDEINRQLELKTTELTKLQQEKQSDDDSLVVLRRDLKATQDMLASKEIMMVDLKGMGDSPDAHARLVVDMKQKIWKLYAGNMKQLDGRVYEFWLVTADQQKVPMGSFTVDASGMGHLGDKVPEPMPTLVAAAITDEPGPGMKEPTGSMHVKGEIH